MGAKRVLLAYTYNQNSFKFPHERRANVCVLNQIGWCERDPFCSYPTPPRREKRFAYNTHILHVDRLGVACLARVHTHTHTGWLGNGCAIMCC